MSYLRRFKIRHRLFLLIALVVGGGLATIAFTLELFESTLLDAKTRQTRSLVETAHSLVESFHARERSGELTTDAAQQGALAALKDLRYEGDNYFWVNDLAPRMIMHPMKPELDGSSLGEMRDPNGVRLFQEMVAQVRRNGDGVVHYAWSKPGHDEPVPKVSYVKGFAPWQWVIGSGIYIDDVHAAFREIALTVSLIALVVIALLGGLLVLIGRSIALPICAASRAMQEIASGDGDLTRLPTSAGNDEVSTLTAHFNAFVGRIREIVATVGQTTAQLATAAEELSAVTRENSAAAAAQRVETDQVATAVNELSASAGEIAGNAADAAGAARQTDAAATAGRQVMARAVASMQELSGEIDAAGDVIDGLKVESENIGSVVDVIRGIAEQTNLLALNAAIEAARAGEQGRGFAVVADEVRTLASRTQASTAEIQTMIGSLQGEAGKAVGAMQDGRARTRQALEQAAEADRSLAEIVQLVASISGMNSQIAGAAQEQTAVSQQLDHSVVHIAALAERAVSGSEQIAVASGELARLGEDLRGLVSRFRT